MGNPEHCCLNSNKSTCKYWMKLHPEILYRMANKLWINKLELAAIMVNLYAATAVAKDIKHIVFDWQPMLYC